MMTLDFTRPGSVGDVCFSPPLLRARRARSKGETRNVLIDPSLNYTLIRAPSREFTTLEELAEFYSEGKLTEDMLCYLRHPDADVMSRNPDIPVYEGCFLFSAFGGKEKTHIKAQKSHLKQIYAQCERTDMSRAMEILEDGTPYMVDRHAFSRLRQRETKLRYERKKLKKE